MSTQKVAQNPAKEKPQAAREESDGTRVNPLALQGMWEPHERSHDLSGRLVMTEKELENLRGRADAKLHYAQIHLEELRHLPAISGGAFDLAHQESFLFHLVGAKEAFVGELNVYYGVNLSPDNVSPGNVRDALKERGLSSLELEELHLLEKDPGSWLAIAKRMRNYTTHVGHVPRDYRITPGGEPEKVVSLRHPDEQNLVIPGDILDVFARWLQNMTSLLERLRRTAIATNRQGVGLE